VINREGHFDNGDERSCTSCATIFKKTSKTVTLCPTCNTKRIAKEAPEVRMYRRAKSRAKERGHEFTLSKEDVVIPTHCPVFGMPLVVHSGRSGGKADSPALDRIDNSRGYVKGNVQVLSHKANVMKADASREELIAFANWVLKENS
jgi:DNA-directed RNA polymerase subunit RPC12/RpoP